MDPQNQHSSQTDLSLIQPVEQTQVKNFMANVFAYMFMALGVSALFAYLFSTNLELLQYLVSSTGRGLNALGYIVMFAPLGVRFRRPGGAAEFRAEDQQRIL